MTQPKQRRRRKARTTNLLLFGKPLGWHVCCVGIPGVALLFLIGVCNEEKKRREIDIAFSQAQAQIAADKPHYLRLDEVTKLIDEGLNAWRTQATPTTLDFRLYLDRGTTVKYVDDIRRRFDSMDLLSYEVVSVRESPDVAEGAAVAYLAIINMKLGTRATGAREAQKRYIIRQASNGMTSVALVPDV